MTIGSFTKNERKVVPMQDTRGDWFYLQLGKLHSRSWSGGDYPSSRQMKPFSFQREPGMGVPPRPPKRSRTEEHDYTMSASGVDNQVVWMRSKEDPNWVLPGDFDSVNRISSWSNPWSSNDDLALMSQLRTRVAGSDFNAGVFLGEGRESLRLITDSASRIYLAMKAAKRLNFAGVSSALFRPSQVRRYKNYRENGWLNDDNFLKWERRRWDMLALRQRPSDRDVSSLWLEFAYGWKPLLQDVYGACAFLAHQLNTPLQPAVRIRRTAKGTNVNGSSSSYFGYSSKSVVVRKDIIARFTEVDPVKLSGLTDPLSVAWELVPFSFVVDWFIPVGNYLSARGLASSLKGSFVISTLTRVTGAGVVSTPASPLQTLGSAGSAWQVSFSRQVNQPIGSLVSLPSMKPLGSVPSWMRAANAVSLLDQLRPRK